MRVGDLIEGRFELEKLAGAGGSGSVYRARDRKSGARVALKLLKALDGERERFVREASILAALEHEAIVRYVTHGIADDGAPYLVMEWLDGRTLSRALSAQQKLPPASTLRLLLQACHALAFAHARGVVHRDVKPSNLFLLEREVAQLKVLDFGLARSQKLEDSLTATGVAVGTPGYMAPEQVRGDEAIGPAADVFSLGCVLFECLTGRPAFGGRHATAIFSKILMEPAPRVRDSGVRVSRDLDGLLQRMLAKDPERRPADARTLALELGLLLEHEQRAGGSSSPPPSLTRREQALLCVLMIRLGYDAPPTQRGPRSQLLTANQRLRALALRFGGKLSFLSNGVVVIVFEPDARAPVAATDLAHQAARCALAVQRLLPGAPLALGTGMGVADTTSLIGDVIDKAATLLHSQIRARAPAHEKPDLSRALREQLEDGDAAPRISVDDVTAGLLESRFDVASRQGGRGYLIATKRERDAGRLLLGKPTPCVGREGELSRLEAWLDECVDERSARAVLVTATAGVGKSRLRHEFTRRVRERFQAIEIWQAWGEATRRGSPLGLLAQAVRGGLGLEEGEPLEVSRKKILARVQAVVAPSDAARVSAFLGELVGAGCDETPQLLSARRDSRLMGDHIARAWLDWLAAECARGPIVLILEDVHWGDAGSLKLIDSGLRQLAEHPLLVMALGRPEVTELFPGLWQERGLFHLSLRPLSRKASQELASVVLGAPADAEVVQRVVSRGDGNAFFLEELIRAEAEGNAGELPPTVLAMLQARLARLSPEARQLLRAGSVFGEVFWDGGVVALSPSTLPGPLLREQLRALVQSEWLMKKPESRLAQQDEYAFRHALLRDAAYASLTEEDRVLGHGLAGAWLERSGERDPVTLAEHFKQAGELARAASWYERAASLALKGDFESAIQHAEHAITCGARGSLLGRLRLIQAEAHNWRGEHAAAAAAAVEALKHLDATGSDADRWAHAVNQSTWAHGNLDNFDEVRRWSGVLLDRARERCTDLHVLALAWSAMNLVACGHNTEARRITDWLKAHAAESSEDPLVAAIVNTLLASEHFAGNLSEALRRFAAAEACLKEADDDRQRQLAIENGGAVCLMLGEYERAESMCHAAVALAERLRATGYCPLANWAMARARLGNVAEACRVLEGILTQPEAEQSPRLSGFVRTMLAELLTASGEHAAAIENARAGLSTGILPLYAYALCVSSRAQRALGRVAEALDAAREALTLADSGTSIHEYERLVRLEFAEALHASGDQDAAHTAIRQARRTLDTAAACIDDAQHRHSFLTRVPENVRILELSRAWLGA